MENDIKIQSGKDFLRCYPSSFILLINDNIDQAKKQLLNMGLVPAGKEGLEWMTEENMKLPHVVIHNNYIYKREVLLDHLQLKKWEIEPGKLLPIAHYSDLLEKYKEEVHRDEQKKKYFSDLCDFERTPQKCWHAVLKDGENLALVPDHVKTPEMCRLAIQTGRKWQNGLSTLIKEIPFAEVCLEELKKMPLDRPIEILDKAGYIRPEVMNDEIADYLVSKVVGQSLNVIPVHLQTKERIEKAVEVSGSFSLLRNVRKDMLTPELYLKAAKHSWISFCYIPPKNCTPEICLEVAIRFKDAFEPARVPMAVRSGSNIYSLFRTLENATKSSDYTVEQMKDLYNGKPLTVKNVHTDYQVHDNCVITFDKKHKQLLCRPVQKQTQEQVEKPMRKLQKTNMTPQKRKI